MTDQSVSPMNKHPVQHVSDGSSGYAELAAGSILSDLDPIESSAFRLYERDHPTDAEQLSRELEEAAALAAVAMAELEIEAMPQAMTIRLQRAAGAHIADVRRRSVPSNSGIKAGAGREVIARLMPVSSGAAVVRDASGESDGETKLTSIGLTPLGWFGWFAAAACLALFVSVWRPVQSVAVDPLSVGNSPSVAQLRTQLATTPGTVVAQWQDIFADIWPSPEIPGIRGDVVWSPERQTGYLRLVGMPANNPSVEQYQLWVVDADRGLSQRIDGGVFDVTDTGEVIVPINARIPVGSAMAFAITIEQPGGVVVSDMTRRGPIAIVPQS